MFPVCIELKVWWQKESLALMSFPFRTTYCSMGLFDMVTLVQAEITNSSVTGIVWWLLRTTLPDQVVCARPLASFTSSTFRRTGDCEDSKKIMSIATAGAVFLLNINTTIALAH